MGASHRRVARMVQELFPVTTVPIMAQEPNQVKIGCLCVIR